MNNQETTVDFSNIEPKGYIDYILIYLNEKKRKNPQYSLRALARDLEISPSTLSEAINRRHCLSLKTALKIVEVFQLNEKDKEQFELLLKSEMSTKKRN